MSYKNTKLKILGLLASSAFTLHVQGLDLNNYIEIDTGSTASPTLLSDKYYSNYNGETYLVMDTQIELMYDLEDSILININDEKTLGYLTNSGSLENNFFTCNITECDNENSRIYLENIGNHSVIFGSAPHSYSALNMFPNSDRTLVIGKSVENPINYEASIINNSGDILDSFSIYSPTYISPAPYSFTFNHLYSITGATQEKNFKLIVPSESDYSVLFKQWNESSQTFSDLVFQLNSGEDINVAYPNGLAPISISNPVINSDGSTSYKVVLAKIVDGSLANASISHILWGDILVTNEAAKFTSEIKSAPYIQNIYAGALISSSPAFHSDNTFTFKNQKLDFSLPQETALTTNELLVSNRTLYPNIFSKSPSGNVVAREVSANYILYIGSRFNLTSSNVDVDPYTNPNFSVTLTPEVVGDYFGVEATCSLQNTNVTATSHDYLVLSENTLQIPIEWNSLTGEWKGVQSLTGLNSITGSHDFAQFELMAEVTTGTWSMNCSGIASDINGNSIPLAPTDITINLDDKIHGGTGLVSGQITMPNTSNYSGVVVTITLNGRQIEVTTESDGSFSFDRLVDGEYQIHLFNEQLVAACNTVTLNATNNNAPLSIQMYAGDINNDGTIDIGDFSLLSGLMGLTDSDEGYNSLADLNHDGNINVQDLSILGSHFGTDHCEVSPE